MGELPAFYKPGAGGGFSMGNLAPGGLTTGPLDIMFGRTLVLKWKTGEKCKQLGGR